MRKKQRMQKRTNQKSILDYQLEALAYRFVIDTMLSMNVDEQNQKMTEKICESAFHVVTIIKESTDESKFDESKFVNDEHCTFFGGIIHEWADKNGEIDTFYKNPAHVIWLASQMIQQLTISGAFPPLEKIESNG